MALLHFRIEVFDDDGKKGPDKKDDRIGVAFFSVKQLEAAHLIKSTLNITDGKKGRVTGKLLVRSFKVRRLGWRKILAPSRSLTAMQFAYLLR